MAEAERLCRERGARLTSLRRRVLEVVWGGHKPVGAYDILEVLRGERGVAAPPTVYRALEFLMEQGLIHRVESLNAYVGCSAPGTEHGSRFLICRSCGRAAEIDDTRLDDAIAETAAAAGFTVEHRTVEITGLCPACAKKKGDVEKHDG